MEDYTNFGDIARKRLGQQCQYASRYVDGAIPGYPNLGKGLRFKGEARNYHSIQIHRDDVEEFIRRYGQFQEDRFHLSYDELHKKYEITEED